MLVYRVDGSEINPAGCVDSADGEYPRGRGEYRVDESEINSAGCVDSADGEYPMQREGGMHPKHGPPPFPLFLLSPSPSQPLSFFLPQNSIFCFVHHYAAVLTFTPPVVNQLGGAPVLISGLCVQPGDFIGCVFDDRTLGIPAEVIDDSTFMCVTPLMTTLGEVEAVLTKFLPQPPDIRITANLITSMLTLSE